MTKSSGFGPGHHCVPKWSSGPWWIRPRTQFNPGMGALPYSMDISDIAKDDPRIAQWGCVERLGAGLAFRGRDGIHRLHWVFKDAGQRLGLVTNCHGLCSEECRRRSWVVASVP